MCDDPSRVEGDPMLLATLVTSAGVVVGALGFLILVLGTFVELGR